MSEFLDTAQEQLKKIPAWGWMLLAGGFFTLAYLGSKNKQTVTYTQTPDYTSGQLETNKVSESEVAARINQVVAGFNAQMDERLAEQASEFNQQMTDREASFNEQLQEYNKGWSDRVNALTSSFNETNQTTQNQLGQITEAINKQVVEEQNKNSAYTVGLGSGSDTSKAGLGIQAARSGDKATLDSEIARASSVLAYRKSEGLDTTAQERYLNNMLTARAGVN